MEFSNEIKLALKKVLILSKEGCTFNNHIQTSLKQRNFYDVELINLEIHIDMGKPLWLVPPSSYVNHKPHKLHQRDYQSYFQRKRGRGCQDCKKDEKKS